MSNVHELRLKTKSEWACELRNPLVVFIDEVSFDKRFHECRLKNLFEWGREPLMISRVKQTQMLSCILNIAFPATSHITKINLIKSDILFGIRVGRSLGGHMITNKISQENLIWDVACISKNYLNSNLF